MQTALLRRPLLRRNVGLGSRYHSKILCPNMLLIFQIMYLYDLSLSFILVILCSETLLIYQICTCMYDISWSFILVYNNWSGTQRKMPLHTARLVRRSRTFMWKSRWERWCRSHDKTYLLPIIDIYHICVQGGGLEKGQDKFNMVQWKVGVPAKYPKLHGGRGLFLQTEMTNRPVQRMRQRYCRLHNFVKLNFFLCELTWGFPQPNKGDQAMISWFPLISSLLDLNASTPLKQFKA